MSNDPEYGQLIEAKIATLALASRNAWMLGRADIARERKANMMNAAIGENPYRTALSSCRAAQLLVLLRDYEQAVALARRAFELAEKHQFRICYRLRTAFLVGHEQKWACSPRESR